MNERVKLFLRHGREFATVSGRGDADYFFKSADKVILIDITEIGGDFGNFTF